MKKTILAVSITALFATSAQAATVYDADGVSADVYGRMEFNITDNNADSDTVDGVGSARMGFKGKSAINTNVSAIAKGEWQIAAENGDSSKFEARHLYAGFETADYGTIIFGQTDTAFYKAVEATDLYESFGYGAFGNVEDGRQEGQIIYSGQFSGVYVGASYQFQNEDFKTADDVLAPLDSSYALTLGYSLADLAGYAGYHVQEFANAEDKKNYALSVAYTLNDLYLAAAYAGSEQDNVADYQGYDLFASYAIDAAKVYGGYTFQENTTANEDTFDAITLGTGYAFNANMYTWVEYQADMLDENDDQWVAGVRYSF